MNCCDAWGQCTQGRDCPVRTGKVLPHQAAHAARIESNGCAAEGGNVWFAEPEPEPEPLELSAWESRGAWILISLCSVISLCLISGLLGFVSGRWLA
jgi:hypothetical protein